MNPNITLLSLCAVALLSPAGVAVAKQAGSGNLKLTVTVDHKQYFIGEYVLVHCTIKNGAKEDAITSVPIRLIVTDSSGRAVEKPLVFDTSRFGGRLSTLTLKPGETHTEGPLLSGFCRITRPGHYLIQATTSFFAEGGLAPATLVSATTKVSFYLPNEAQAEKVIEKIEGSDLQKTSSLNYHSLDDQLMGSLNAPVYLQPLLRRLEQGDQYALEGIGSIATPEATIALIDLAEKAPSEVTVRARNTLIARLPTPKTFNELSIRERLAEGSWDDKLAPSVRALARKLLDGSDPASIGAGAEMFESVGTLDDATAIFSAMDHVMQSLTKPHEPDWRMLSFVTYSYPTPLPQLLKAIEQLRLRGLNLNENELSGDGQALAYLDYLRDMPPPRTSQWRKMLDEFCRNPCVTIREAAIRSIPSPVPADCAALIDAAKADPDTGVRNAVLWVTEHRTIISPPSRQSDAQTMSWKRAGQSPTADFIQDYVPVP